MRQTTNNFPLLKTIKKKKNILKIILSRMKQNFSTRENNETDSIPPKKKESQGELKVDNQVVK